MQAIVAFVAKTTYRPPGMTGTGRLSASKRKFRGTDWSACLDFERREGPKKVRHAGGSEDLR